MKIENTKLKGVFEIVSDPIVDKRGTLVRFYDDKIFENFGLNKRWLQESYSYTKKKYTLRGLHFQFPPYTECKLIRIIRGEMLWVVVDLKKGSETFGEWEALTLSGEKFSSIYVEAGFAHGCVSLRDNCDLVILSDNYFSNVSGSGIIWNDPGLNIDWKLKNIEPIISESHKNYPSFEEFKKIYAQLDC